MTEIQTISDRLSAVEHQLKFFKDAYIQVHNAILKGTNVRIDDHSFRVACSDLRALIQDLNSLVASLNDESIIGTLQFMAKKIHEMELAIRDMKENGVKKRVHLDLTIDGYTMEKKKHQDIDPEKLVKNLLDTLSEKESLTLIHRFGLLGNETKTFQRIGKILGLSTGTASTHYRKALRKCRHPQRKTLVSRLTHLELKKAILGERDGILNQDEDEEE